MFVPLEIAHQIINSTSWNLADAKNVRLICWAFAQSLPPLTMAAHCACDFGRSWSLVILWVNAALEWDVWYIFPQPENHPLYQKKQGRLDKMVRGIGLALFYVPFDELKYWRHYFF